jgi:hypothetical protein
MEIRVMTELRHRFHQAVATMVVVRDTPYEKNARAAVNALIAKLREAGEWGDGEAR